MSGFEHTSLPDTFHQLNLLYEIAFLFNLHRPVLGTVQYLSIRDENVNLRHMYKTGDSSDPIDHNSQKTSYTRANTRLEKGSLSPRQRPAETCVNQPLNLLCPCMKWRRNTCAKKGWGISHPPNLERRGRGSQPTHTGGDHKYATRTRLIVAHKISCITNSKLLYDIFDLYCFFHYMRFCTSISIDI